MSDDVLSRLRSICLGLPSVSERQSHGEPAWFAGQGKQFVCFADHHHDDRLAFWCAAPYGRQHELVTSDAGHYFVPPYVGGRGWLGVRLDVPVDWAEIAEIVQDAYRQVATRRLVAELDGRQERDDRAAL
ncbi:MAG TPA: MmcQ/YjbR family DNA-binding protein [Streptosporangiaceae bacterium]